MRRRRLGRGLALATLLLAVGATPVLALSLWTLTGSPLTLTVGTATDVDLTATNVSVLTPAQIGCVTVFVPESTAVGNVSARSVPGNWSASTAAVPGGTLITYHAASLSDRLPTGESGVFRARVTPSLAGTQVWQGLAYDAITCDADAFPQSNLVFTITLPSLPSPTPAATPSPTPMPTPTPTPVATTTPSPTAAPPASSTPGPAATPGPSASPGASATAPVASVEPSGSPAPDERSPGPNGGSGGIAIGSDDGSAGGTGATWLTVPGGNASAGLPTGLDVSASGLGGVGVLLWAVPAAALGIPGFLVVLVVLLQAGGGLIWLPVARRRIGGFGRRSQRPVQ